MTAGKEIAAQAEVKGVYVIPHNPLGPVSTAACLQLDACIPNFEVQEYPMSNGNCRLDRERKAPFKVENGYIVLSDEPGPGVELIDRIEDIFDRIYGHWPMLRSCQYLCVGKDSPLACESFVTLEQIAGEPMVMLKDNFSQSRGIRRS